MGLGPSSHPPGKLIFACPIRARIAPKKITEERMTDAQEEKFHGYTWAREALNKTDKEEDIKRLGNLYTVRITVTWGDRGQGRGKKQQESYVTFWRKPE